MCISFVVQKMFFFGVVVFHPFPLEKFSHSLHFLFLCFYCNLLVLVLALGNPATVGIMDRAMYSELDYTTVGDSRINLDPQRFQMIWFNGKICHMHENQYDESLLTGIGT